MAKASIELAVHGRRERGEECGLWVRALACDVAAELGQQKLLCASKNSLATFVAYFLGPET